MIVNLRSKQEDSHCLKPGQAAACAAGTGIASETAILLRGKERETDMTILSHVTKSNMKRMKLVRVWYNYNNSRSQSCRKRGPNSSETITIATPSWSSDLVLAIMRMTSICHANAQANGSLIERVLDLVAPSYSSHS